MLKKFSYGDVNYIAVGTSVTIISSSFKLKNQGTNNSSSNIINKIKLKNKISVNLFGDKIYKEKI